MIVEHTNDLICIFARQLMRMLENKWMDYVTLMQFLKSLQLFKILVFSSEPTGRGTKKRQPFRIYFGDLQDMSCSQADPWSTFYGLERCLA